MKVLFLFPDTLEEGKYRGGVAEFLLALTPRLQTLNIQSVIYTKDKSLKKLSTPRQLCEGVTIYRGPFTKPGILFGRKKLKIALELCQKEKIDLVHAQGTYTAGFLALKIFQKLAIPYVVTSHSDILPTNSKRLQRPSVIKRLSRVLQYSQSVTHLTPAMEKASHDILNTQNKSSLITNGIDYQSWKNIASLPEKNYVLAIGRLERGKGFHVLIDMYKKLLEEKVTTSLVIAGTGKAETDFQNQARALGINVVTEFKDFSCIPEKSILFTGYISGELKKQLIMQSKIILFATQPALWEEAFGIVLLEAMAAGKSLVASDVNSARFLELHGLKALFVTPDNINEWTQAIKKLINDDALRMHMGEENQKYAKQFDWGTIAGQYAQVFTPPTVKSNRKQTQS